VRVQKEAGVTEQKKATAAQDGEVKRLEREAKQRDNDMRRARAQREKLAKEVERLSRELATFQCAARDKRMLSVPKPPTS
jgi:molecular chaperone GrpE (heat shock protein)